MANSNTAESILTSSGVELDMSADAFGELRRSNDVADDFDALRERMADDGYLYLPGYLSRERVLNVRRGFADRLSRAGSLDPARDPIDCVAHPQYSNSFAPALSNDFPELLDLLYGGPVMEFYAGLLGGEVRHYDFTWVRAVAPGGATQPHCDIVYMGRGTTNVFTCWLPFTDVSWEIGGLMLLERSHQVERLKAVYGTKDVDAWCVNRREKYTGMGQGGNIGLTGRLSDNPARIRARLGGRWLSTQFRIGDLLTFGMYTVHASLDNRSMQIRLSTDARYQLASEPADERWIGDHPIGHGENAARGVIC